MYVLARREGDSVLMLDGHIEVKVLSVTGKIVRLGFNAPKEVSIERMDTPAKGEVQDHEQT